MQIGVFALDKILRYRWSPFTTSHFMPPCSVPIITFWSCELGHLIIYIMFASSGKRLFCLSSMRSCIALGGPGMLICHHKGAECKYSTPGTHTVGKRCNNVKRSVSDRSQRIFWGICITCIRICVMQQCKDIHSRWVSGGLLGSGGKWRRFFRRNRFVSITSRLNLVLTAWWDLVRAQELDEQRRWEMLQDLVHLSWEERVKSFLAYSCPIYSILGMSAWWQPGKSGMSWDTCCIGYSMRNTQHMYFFALTFYKHINCLCCMCI